MKDDNPDKGTETSTTNLPLEVVPLKDDNPDKGTETLLSKDYYFYYYS